MSQILRNTCKRANANTCKFLCKLFCLLNLYMHVLVISLTYMQGGGDSNCFNLYRIEASPSNQGTPLIQKPRIPTVSGGEDISVSVTSGLVRNTVYSVNIVSVNVNGENSSVKDIQLSKSSQSQYKISKVLSQQPTTAFLVGWGSLLTQHFTFVRHKQLYIAQLCKVYWRRIMYCTLSRLSP